MSEKLHSLKDLLVLELKDIYDAEHRLVEALPKMAEASSSAKLKDAFLSHLDETKGQIRRLQQMFSHLNEQAKAKTCEAMKGLVKEGEECIKAEGPRDIKDALLIGAAQKVEHYEIASYGTARALAEQLQLQEVIELIDETISEEEGADKKLTSIAETELYPGRKSMKVAPEPTKRTA